MTEESGLPANKRRPPARRLAMIVCASVMVIGAAAWGVSRARSGPPPVLAVSEGPTPEQAAAVIQAARAHPNDPVPRLRLGNLLVAASRHEDALPPLLFATRDPRTAGAAAILLAKCADDPRRAAAALPGTQLAVKTAPQDPRTWEGLIRVHFAGGDRAAADAALRAALRRFPKVQRFRFILAERLEQDGEAKKAVNVYGAALKKEPDADAQLRLGFLLARMQFPDAARTAFRRAVEQNPGSVAPYLGLSKTSLELGLLDEAETNAYAALQVAPDDPEAAYLLGRVLLTRGNPESVRTARELLERVLAVRPDHTDARYQLALLHLRQSRAREAAALFSQVVAANPDRLDARQNYGKALRQAGELPAAEEQEQIATGLAELEQERNELIVRTSHDPRNPNAYCALGDFYLKRGAGERAVSAYRHALSLDPRSPRARGGLARALRVGR